MSVARTDLGATEASLWSREEDLPQGFDPFAEGSSTPTSSTPPSNESPSSQPPPSTDSAPSDATPSDADPREPTAEAYSSYRTDTDDESQSDTTWRDSGSAPDDLESAYSSLPTDSSNEEWFEEILYDVDLELAVEHTNDEEEDVKEEDERTSEADLIEFREKRQKTRLTFKVERVRTVILSEKNDAFQKWLDKDPLRAEARLGVNAAKLMLGPNPYGERDRMDAREQARAREKLIGNTLTQRRGVT